MSEPRTWLVAFDFSDHAKAALERARSQLAALGGGRLVIAYVHAPATDGAGIDLGAIGPAFAAHEAAVIASAEKQLDELLPTLPPVAGGTVIIDRRIITGRPADKLVALADELHAEQIVIGSHGRRGFERFLLGSVAERVLRLAHCSVLVIKTPH